MNPTNSSMHERAASAGFTLIEVMIAMVMLAIGMLAVGAAQLASLRVSSQSQHRTQALYLAEEQMVKLQAMPRNAGTFTAAGTHRDAQPLELGDSTEDDDLTTFIREWTITPNQPAPGLATLQVQVTWNVNGDGQEGNIQTVILDGVKETQ